MCLTSQPFLAARTEARARTFSSGTGASQLEAALPTCAPHTSVGPRLIAHMDTMCTYRSVVGESNGTSNAGGDLTNPAHQDFAVSVPPNMTDLCLVASGPSPQLKKKISISRGVRPSCRSYRDLIFTLPRRDGHSRCTQPVLLYLCPLSPLTSALVFPSQPPVSFQHFIFFLFLPAASPSLLFHFQPLISCPDLPAVAE